MKQFITFQQWEELSKDQKNDLFSAGFQKDWKMNIGQMIEFLGDDFVSITWISRIDDINTRVKTDFGTYIRVELCDALWSACKHKLKE